MAYAEKRGNLWRARWRGPDGTLESKPGFHTRKAAENYGRDQEAAIRANTYVDPRAGKITLTEWVNQWYPALDLEPTTLSNYRYQIEVHILPAFGNRALASITAEEVSAWERQIAASGYLPAHGPRCAVHLDDGPRRRHPAVHPGQSGAAPARKRPQGPAAHPAHRAGRESVGDAYPGAAGRRAMRRPVRPRHRLRDDHLPWHTPACGGVRSSASARNASMTTT